LVGVEVNNALLEVGPAAVRRLSPGPVCAADPSLVRSALFGIDDEVVLYEDRPTKVDWLLRRIFGGLVNGDCESLTLLFPSDWWESRIVRVVASAELIVKHVVALHRAHFVYECTSARTIVELGLEHLTISRDGEVVQVIPRSLLPTQSLSGHEWASPVHLDVPPDSATTTELAELRGKVAATGRLDASVNVEEAVFHWQQTSSVPIRSVWRTIAARAVALTVAVAGMAAVVIVGTGESEQPLKLDGGVELVEGRVAVQVPSGWHAERISAGPGSKRVQVSASEMNAPDRDGLALHITQAYTPGQELSGAAEALWQLTATNPDSAFTAFTGRDDSFGRPTITYREVRPSRVVRWHIVIDGSTRIGIGCQSRLGRESDVDQVCGAAVRSARELPGTAKSGAN
jgi:type VII secretion-associated protein (TIGR03931 family)